jgi:outer membrane protein OmpA-like peptidoglycan-associated protein
MIFGVLLAGSRARAQDDLDSAPTQGPSVGQDQAQAQGQGLSREMKSAIHLYDTGDDIEAMNRFMDILTKGDPGERPMANEYLNLITHRMSSVGGDNGSPAPRPAAPPPVPAATAPIQPPIAVEPTRSALPPPTEVMPVPAPRRAASGQEMSAANKALMRKEIQSRLRAAEDKSLADLREVDGVRVVMRANGDPAAIGIPSSLLFQSGISFQRDASRVLEPLTKLVFALGSTQVVILPEGTAIGDAKVLDMRRTMGVSAHFYDEGVAPPRVRVNLLNTQVDMPRALLDFKGVVVAFVYDQPMNLAVESAVGDELGPPISLGVFPSQLRPSRSQGAIIEFSVSDPPAGLTSWKFQLLQPSADGAELAPLQEVVGGGPVFHQIFWNARQNYFGDSLAPGRYECVLTATDAKNRQRALHRWITVLGDAQPEEKLLAAPPEKAAVAPAPESAAPSPSSTAAAAPGDELPGDSAAPLVKGVKPSVEVSTEPPPPAPKKRIAARPAKKKKKSKSKASPDASDAAGAAPGRYKLQFDPNTHQLTDSAERSLAKAAGALSKYPLETLKVVGHSGADEADGAALAKDRAQMVFGLLINRYQVDPKKIAMSTADGNDAAMVEVIVVRND